MRRALLLGLAVGSASLAILEGAQTGVFAQSLPELLARVGRAVELYYTRAQSIVYLEDVSVQTMGYDMTSDLLSQRRLTYELRVAWEASADGAAPEAIVQRDLLKVNNRPPKPSDKPKCLDPAGVSPDTLQMLLPRNQNDYTFKVAGVTKISGRQAIMIDYRPREIGKVTVTPYEEREDCFSVDFPGHVRGRIWVDIDTADVVRLDEWLSGMVDVRLPPTRNRRESVLAVFERVDTTTSYRPVNFVDPDETVMLPYSVESMQVVRNAGPRRVRKTTKFSNYRRFTTAGRIVENN